jgi:glycosyltransferase involved in cell wall biosynthesis
MPCQGAVVVHDLSFRAHPEYFPRIVAWYMRWLTSRAIQRAQRVFTISEFSRREILRFHPANREKVVVIPCGVASRFRPATSEMNLATEWATLARYGINGSYILALGNIHPRKNLVRLLEAYLCLRRQRKSVPRMVWAGLPRWDSNRLLDKARAAGVILTGFVAEDDLPILYRQATMLVYPSIYEGFGLPPLEAMACGTPVVASNATSLPEVVGEAALTVNTTDVTEITTAMARLLDDTPLRKQLQESGLERAREFTWARAARELLAWLER